jgi:hypothetical protein
MKAFWIFILLLIVAGGVALSFRVRSPGDVPPSLATGEQGVAMPTRTASSSTRSTSGAPIATAPPSAGMPNSGPGVADGVPATKTSASSVAAASGETSGPSGDQAMPRIEELLPAPTSYDPEGMSTSGTTLITREVPVGLEDSARTSTAAGVTAGDVAGTVAGDVAGGATTSAYVLPMSDRFPADRLFPAKAELKPDGAVMLDGRFAVPGAGTAEDPYRLTWDLLVSAQETYKPRLGQTRLPQRVAWLDGKHVRVSGFIAFPIASNNPQELLVMLNQWDGCCIGVPPTAYDAVEVKLAAPASPAQRMSTHGTLTGRMKVDPYEDQGWLLGLYIIEDAKLVADQ